MATLCDILANILKYIIIRPNELMEIIRLIRKMDDLPVTMYPISYRESNLPGIRSFAAR
jgi:hypothetical protein